MSFTSITVLALMCSSVVIAFVLQPPKQEDAVAQDSNSRCRGESLEFIRKELLDALNLQAEPRMPEGARKQWSGTAERLKAVAVSSLSSSYDDGLDTSGCCAKTSEVSMTDLGWDNWMIYPQSITLVHCAPCGHNVSCRPQPNATHRDDLQLQAPCCHPTTQEAVHVIYMDEWNTAVITSMHLTRRCGCTPPLQPPQE
ncbi:bone morphogenetic protein 6-like [Vanacampus margaritifer]